MSLKHLSIEEREGILNKLPSFIQDIIEGGQSSRVNDGLNEEFDLGSEQYQRMINIFFLIYARRIALSELKDILQKELYLDEETAKTLTLSIAQKKLWPMKDYLGGVESLIKNLGGELPKEDPNAKYKKTVAEQLETMKANYFVDHQTIFDNTTQKDIKSALEEYKGDLENQIITSINVVNTSNGESFNGSIKNWLNEYIRTLGAGYHPNLERIGFLYNNANAKRLSEVDKIILGAILKSYDDGDMLPFSEKTHRLMVDKLKEE